MNIEESEEISKREESVALAVISKHKPQDHVVIVGDCEYTPSQLQISVKDRVWFFWKDTKEARNVIEVLPDARHFKDRKEGYEGLTPEQFALVCANDSMVSHQFESGPLRDSPHAFQHTFHNPGVYTYISANDYYKSGVVEVRVPNDVKQVAVRTHELDPYVLVVRPGDIVCWLFKKMAADPLMLGEAEGKELHTKLLAAELDNLHQMELADDKLQRESTTSSDNLHLLVKQEENKEQAGETLEGAEDVADSTRVQQEIKLECASEKGIPSRCAAQVFIEPGVFHVTSKAFFMYPPKEGNNWATDNWVSTIVVNDLPDDEFLLQIYNPETGEMFPKELVVSKGQTVVWFPHNAPYKPYTTATPLEVTLELDQRSSNGQGDREQREQRNSARASEDAQTPGKKTRVASAKNPTFKAYTTTTDRLAIFTFLELGTFKVSIAGGIKIDGEIHVQDKGDLILI